MSAAYDTNNIFAKILRGEFPCYKVYEDEHVLAFLDIMPRAPGHTLVIPKAPARNILDIKPDDYAHVARGAHKIAAAAMKAFKADGITIQQFNEAAADRSCSTCTCTCCRATTASPCCRRRAARKTSRCSKTTRPS